MTDLTEKVVKENSTSFYSFINERIKRYETSLKDLEKEKDTLIENLKENYHTIKDWYNKGIFTYEEEVTSFFNITKEFGKRWEEFRTIYCNVTGKLNTLYHAGDYNWEYILNTDNKEE